MSFPDTGPNEDAEIQKNNNIPPENYLNDNLNIDANQLPENHNDEEIINVECMEVDNDINELTKSIIDLSLNTGLLVESANSDLVSHEQSQHQKQY